MLTILYLISFKEETMKKIQKSNKTEMKIKCKERNLFLFIKVIPQILKLPMIFSKLSLNVLYKALFQKKN